MNVAVYKPIPFYIAVLVGTWISWFAAAFWSYQQGKEKPQGFCLILGLFVPCVTALLMIYASKSCELLRDFWHRLFVFRMDLSSLIMIVVIFPVVYFLATVLSLFFGKSAEQFSLVDPVLTGRGEQLFKFIIPLLLAPTLEEMGWRGYGVDSLKGSFNLLYTSLLFALLWGLWHVPLFFIKGYYHNELWKLSPVYAVNFFVSLIPVSLLFNWIYFRSFRCILAVVVAHAMLNGLSVLFKMEQFTKCLVTLLLMIVCLLVVLQDKELFLK